MKRSRIARGSFFGILGVVGAWAWSACPPYPPLPLCTQYGGLIQAGVPICCEENATSCRDWLADKYTCIKPSGQIGYLNGRWDQWLPRNCGEICY
jgi:hypothetical protein